MNLFVEQNEQFSEFGKRISQHNLIQIITPIALAFVLSIIGSVANFRNETPILLFGVVAFFLIALYSGKRFKIYTTTSILSYLVLIPIIGILLWIVLFNLMGYFTVLVFPILMLYVGPTFNNTLARGYYISTIEKFKENCLSDMQRLEVSFSKVQPLDTAIDLNKITSDLVGSTITSHSRKRNNEYSITHVVRYLNAAYIFIEKRGALHVFRVKLKTVQSLSLTSTLSSELLDTNETANAIEKLLME